MSSSVARIPAHKGAPAIVNEADKAIKKVEEAGDDGDEGEDDVAVDEGVGGMLILLEASASDYSHFWRGGKEK